MSPRRVVLPLHTVVSPMRGIVASVRSIISAVHGIVSPVRGIVSPVRGIVSSMRGIVSSVRSIVPSTRGIVSSMRNTSFVCADVLMQGAERAVHTSEAFSPSDMPLHISAELFCAPVLRPYAPGEAFSPTNG
jgi:hypothetical protein